ncbi:MAG: ABC transporter substrate-binding protein [Caldilineaceae bacterium]|nr:ABC transporter substrate-binding protein [Caldilineaceae bacterium]
MSNRRLQRLSVVLSVLLILAVVAGCGAPAAAPAGSGGGEAAGGESASTAGMSAAESAARSIPRGKTVILQRAGNTIADYNVMNPYSLGGLGRIRDTLNKTIYEFLFYYNHNDGTIEPWLATGYEYNDTFDEITITLREGVEWSDGEPFTAEDVKYTLETIRATDTLVFAAQMQEWVEDVEVIDDATFKIVLTKPNPRWLFSFLAENSEINLAILPKHIWEGQDPETFSNFDLEQGWPVGTGPYRLVAASESQQVFDRRDDWWAAKSGFAELPEIERFIRIPGGDAASAARLFAQGEVDFGGPLGKGDFEAARERNPDLMAWHNEGPSWGTADACVYILGLNTAVEPFNNPDVRWAINHAIDRNQLVTLAYENSTVPMVMPLSSFGGVLAYQDKIQDLLDQYQVDDPDLAKTEELMTGAGFTKDGEGFWVDGSGNRVVMTISTTGGRRPMGPPLAQQLRDAGFDAIAKHDETGQIVNGIRDGSEHAWIEPHCGAAQEPFPTFSHFHSKFSAPIGQTTGYRWANSRYENPEYDAILDAMEAMSPSVDDPEYVELWHQAADIWLRDLPEIVLAEERHVWTFNAKCWTGWPNEDDPYIAPYDLWGAFLKAILKLESTGAC